MPEGAALLIAGLWLWCGSAIGAAPEDVFPPCLQPMEREALIRFCADWDALLRTDVLAFGETLLPDLLVRCTDTPSGEAHILR